MKEKILYLEGAGINTEDCGDVGNCRIRTAFTNKEGKKIYFEASNGAKNDTIIWSLHYITDEIEKNGYNTDDENKHSIKFDRTICKEWSLENLLKIVQSVGGDFEQVICLPDLAGYRVHKEKRDYKNGNIKNYNYGDEFYYNAEQTERRIVVHDEIYRTEQAKGEKFPNFSFYVDPNNSDYCIKCINNGKLENGERYIRYYIPAKNYVEN